jgi:hypothetical protein
MGAVETAGYWEIRGQDSVVLSKAASQTSGLIELTIQSCRDRTLLLISANHSQSS